MKVKVVLVFMILVLALSAVAADKTTSDKAALGLKGSMNVTVSHDTLVAGKQLKAGDYKLSWAGNGNDVQVTFKLNGKDVATVPAKLVDRDSKAIANSVVLNGDKLTEVWVGGKKSALVFNQ